MDSLVMAPFPPVTEPLTPLCELARRHQTDKGGWHLMYGGCSSDTCHNYTPAYYRMFAGRENKVVNVLEIGVNAGSSLRMWEDHFPNASIVGLDIDARCLFDEGRIRCYAADQNNKKSLLDALRFDGSIGYDLIVDDGSHIIEHQVTSAKALLPFVYVGGYYVIEDIGPDCQPKIITDQIETPDGFSLEFVNVGVGVGKAHCDPGCQNCHGHHGETLIVYHREF